jgi:cell division protease FtsH
MYFLGVILLFVSSNAFLNNDLNHYKRTVSSKMRLNMGLPIVDETSFNELINGIVNHKLSKVLIDSSYKDIISVDSNLETSHITHIDPLVLPSIIEKTVNSGIDVIFLKSNFLTEILNDAGFLFSNILIPFIFFNLIIRTLQRFMPNTNMKPNGKNTNFNQNFNPFGQKVNEANFDAQKYNISLSSWVGSPEVFQEVFEVISYMSNNTEYKEIGAELPKGILLEGPPGTGKTLLAKAIASETNSTFFSVSGSEFVELFIGMGAAKIRNLFEEARKLKPSIIFIDEIDTIGKQRGGANSFGNDEREQTLNQLLAEMDGFADNDQLLIIAATNRKDILDKALVRPGRFDRAIRVSLPDKTSRKQIIKFYLDKTKTSGDINLDIMAELTDGYSGADLKNLLNEASILAVRNKRKTVTSDDITNALEKLTVGLIKNTDTRTDVAKTRVALHEVGHAFLTMKYSEYFDLKKVSIKATYNGAGGYTLFNEKPDITDGGLYTKDILFKRLVIMMGGKAAEHIFYGDNYVSLGATQDLKQANELARKMIGIFGMGDNLKVFYNKNIDGDVNPFLSGSNELYSESTKTEMDIESINLVKLAYAEAIKILEENKDKINLISKELIERQVLFNSDMEKLF